MILSHSKTIHRINRIDFDVAVLDILNKNSSTQAFHHKIEYLLSNSWSFLFRIHLTLFVYCTHYSVCDEKRFHVCLLYFLVLFAVFFLFEFWIFRKLHTKTQQIFNRINIVACIFEGIIERKSCTKYMREGVIEEI